MVGEGCPIISHIFISFGNIYNMLRYFNEKPPYNNSNVVENRPLPPS